MNIFWESSVLGEKVLCLERKLREEAQCSKRKINVRRGNSVLEELSAWRESSMLGEEAQCLERKLSARRGSSVLREEAQCSESSVLSARKGHVVVLSISMGSSAVPKWIVCCEMKPRSAKLLEAIFSIHFLQADRQTDAKTLLYLCCACVCEVARQTFASKLLGSPDVGQTTGYIQKHYLSKIQLQRE